VGVLMFCAGLFAGVGAAWAVWLHAMPDLQDAVRLHCHTELTWEQMRADERGDQAKALYLQRRLVDVWPASGDVCSLYRPVPVRWSEPLVALAPLSIDLHGFGADERLVLARRLEQAGLDDEASAQYERASRDFPTLHSRQQLRGVADAMLQGARDGWRDVKSHVDRDR